MWKPKTKPNQTKRISLIWFSKKRNGIKWFWSDFCLKQTRLPPKTYKEWSTRSSCTNIRTLFLFCSLLIVWLFESPNFLPRKVSDINATCFCSLFSTLFFLYLLRRGYFLSFTFLQITLFKNHFRLLTSRMYVFLMSFPLSFHYPLRRGEFSSLPFSILNAFSKFSCSWMDAVHHLMLTSCSLFRKIQTLLKVHITRVRQTIE